MEFLNDSITDYIKALIFIISIFWLWFYSFSNNFLYYKKFKHNFNYAINLKYYLLKNIIYALWIWFVILSYLWPILSIDINNDINSSNWSDIIFMLDVSKSMNALDASKSKNISRIDFSKKIINNFIVNNNQNNYSVIIFAWEAQNIVPLTQDYNWVLTIINWITTDSLNKDWTDLKNALEEALNTIDKDKSKNIILFSDWWDIWENNDFQFLKELSKNNKIFTIWVWSTSWAMIPTWIDFFWKVTYKSFNWKKVITRLNNKPLINISKLWNWEYNEWDDENVLNQLKKKFIYWDKSITNQNKENDNTYLFIIIAFVFFIIGYFMPLSSKIQNKLIKKNSIWKN